MSPRQRYSLADVRRSYTREKAWAERSGELPAYLLYRPLSFPISYVCLRIGVPILAVTLCGLLISAAMIVAAVRGGPHAYLWVAGLGIAFSVLDCVDGNMARTTGQSSRFGALLDGFVDATFWCALFVALGLLVEHEQASWFAAWGLEIGMASALWVLLNRRVRDHYALMFGNAAVLGQEQVARPTGKQWALYAVVGLENLYAPVLGVLGGVRGLWWVLIGTAGYALVISLAAIGLSLHAAWRRDGMQNASATDGGSSSDRAQHETGVLPAESE